jgi:hypothetical protein
MLRHAQQCCASGIVCSHCRKTGRCGGPHLNPYHFYSCDGSADKKCPVFVDSPFTCVGCILWPSAWRMMRVQHTQKNRIPRRSQFRTERQAITSLALPPTWCGHALIIPTCFLSDMQLGTVRPNHTWTSKWFTCILLCCIIAMMILLQIQWRFSRFRTWSVMVAGMESIPVLHEACPYWMEHHMLQ